VICRSNIVATLPRKRFGPRRARHEPVDRASRGGIHHPVVILVTIFGIIFVQEEGSRASRSLSAKAPEWPGQPARGTQKLSCR